MSSSIRERRKTTVKTQTSFIQEDRNPSVFISTADKSFKLTRYKNKSQQLPFSKNVHLIRPQKIMKTKHEQARREKENRERYNQYVRTLKKQKKYKASLKFLANQKQQLMLRRSGSKLIRKESTPKPVNRLFIQEFNEFQQNKQIKLKQTQNDWEQILLKVDTKKEQSVNKSRSKLSEPYQRIICKYRAFNKQNYDYDNIKGINYCRGIKHQIKRVSSSCHMRSKSSKRVNSTETPPNLKNEKFLKSTLIMPTKAIIDMCKDYNSYARNLKKTMDGFEIYCTRFNQILDKKKALLFVDEF